MKTEIILTMYDMLLGGQAIPRKSFCMSHGISERTFYRYIRQISDFLCGYKQNCVIDCTQKGDYYIKS